MHHHTVAGVTLELTGGDIANQPDVDLVVNAANAQLLPGGGVAGPSRAAIGLPNPSSSPHRHGESPPPKAQAHHYSTDWRR